MLRSSDAVGGRVDVRRERSVVRGSYSTRVWRVGVRGVERFEALIAYGLLVDTATDTA